MPKKQTTSDSKKKFGRFVDYGKVAHVNTEVTRMNVFEQRKNKPKTPKLILTVQKITAKKSNTILSSQSNTIQKSKSNTIPQVNSNTIQKRQSTFAIKDK